MSDILISLFALALFAGFWGLMFMFGALDWMVDARMAAARRTLAGTRYAFDGEVHARVAEKVALATPNTSAAPKPAGWIPSGLAHA